MIDNLLGSLARLQARAAAVAAAFDDATALIPTEAAGADRTAAVTARLGPDGIPTALRVAPDWATRLRPEEFGPAVADACRAAAAERAAEWGRRLERARWQESAGAYLTHGASTRHRPTDAQPPDARPVEEIGRDMRAALRAATHPAEDPTGVPVHIASGRLTLTIAPTGVTTCRADPRWVAGQTATMLANALAEALTEATRRLHAARDAPARAGLLDALLTEAIAAMAAPPPP